jgi:FkbM family methyltransferase
MRLETVLKSLARRAGIGIERLTPAKLMARDAYFAQRRLLESRGVKTIVDLGANTGQTARKYLQMFPNADVHSFEPFDAAFEELGRSVGGSSRAHVHKLAVSDKTEERRFFLQEQHWNNSLLPAVQARSVDHAPPREKEIVVNTITLDEFCRSEGIERIDILKMDIQGGELLALRGAQRLLNDRAVALIYTEVLFASLYEGQASFVDLFSHLAAAGYRLFGLYDLQYLPNHELGWGDAVFVRSDLHA